MEFTKDEMRMLNASVQVKLKSVERAVGAESDEEVKALRLRSVQEYRNLLSKVSNYALELEVKSATVGKTPGK